MPKPNVTRVQSATQSTASVHTLHMSKPNVTRMYQASQTCWQLLQIIAKQGAIKWAVLPKIFLTWTQMKNGCGSSVWEDIAGVWQKRHCVSFPMGEASMRARVYNQSARCFRYIYIYVYSRGHPATLTTPNYSAQHHQPNRSPNHPPIIKKCCQVTAVLMLSSSSATVFLE